jgi:hypothetical protein
MLASIFFLRGDTNAVPGEILERDSSGDAVKWRLHWGFDAGTLQKVPIALSP